MGDITPAFSNDGSSIYVVNDSATSWLMAFSTATGPSTYRGYAVPPSNSSNGKSRGRSRQHDLYGFVSRPPLWRHGQWDLAVADMGSGGRVVRMV